MKKKSENINMSENEIQSSEKKRKRKHPFYTNKRFYTILIIVFSVLLVATVVTGPLARMRSAFAGMSFGNTAVFDTDISVDEDSSSDDSSSDVSSDDAFSADISGMPDMDSDQLPDTDSDSVISGDLPSGSLPGSSDSSDTSDDTSSDTDDDSSSEDSFDISGVPSGGMTISEDESFSSDDDSSLNEGTGINEAVASATGSGSFLSWYGSSWLIIALILLVLNIASIVCRIVIGRRLKNEAKEELKEQAKEEGRIYIEKKPAKKEKNAKTAWIIPLCVVLAIILIVNLISSGGAQTSAQTSASDLSGTVSSGTIETTVPGAGTLESEDAVEISFASGVTVTKWYVSNGDTVEEGDTLAKVDKTTVLAAIATVQEAIEALDEEIASHEDDEISDTITAAAAGRIKAVYAQEDTSVVDTMYESGALLIISLDGLMAVEIETDELSRGDEVTITLSDGTEEEGEVESVTNGVAVITLTDEGTDLGDTVTVTDSDGNEIGTGTLYVHSALKVTGFSGTVSEISVELDDEVDAGDTLITLEDTDYTAEYEALIDTRSELSDQIASLFKLYATGYLYAETDGVISGVDESLTDSDDDASSDEEEVSDSASVSSSSTSAAAEKISVTTVALSSAILSDDDSEVSEEEQENSSDSESSDSDTGEDEEDEDADEDEEDEDDESIVGFVSGVQLSEDESYVTVTITTLSGDSLEVEISSERSIYTFESSGFSSVEISDIEEGDIIFYASDEEAPVYVFTLSSSSEESDAGSTGGEGQGQENSQGSDSSSGEDTGSDSQSLTDALTEYLTGSTSSDTGSDSSSDASSLLTAATDTSTTGDVSTTTEAVEVTYSVSEAVLCSITPQDYMTVEITIDELDILSVSVGQSATVTLDAYVGQSFEGEVISVSVSPSNSGGNSKYTAVIQIERTQDMLTGMNASVNIVIDETADVLIVPVEALFEEDGVTYIYTSFDEKSGTYSDAVEVTTGVSDGEYVEITEGLSEGDTYYYSLLDTVNYSSTTVTGTSGLFSFGN